MTEVFATAHHRKVLRIGIVGGGAAGLAATWLSHGQHDVTLFEQQDRFGGHAHTIEVDDDDAPVPIEAGFEFFSRRTWPVFNRLLDALDVERRDHPMRITVFRAGQGRGRVLQPIRLDGGFVPARLGARPLSDLAQLALVLTCVAPLMRAREAQRLAPAARRVAMLREERGRDVVGNAGSEPATSAP